MDKTDKVLYGMTPLPYATGLFPLALNEAIDIKFLPAVKDAVRARAFPRWAGRRK
nr:hypothetical protein [Fournierella massiliensis]